MTISVGIGWQKIPGNSSRNSPGILPFLVGLPGFLEESSRNRGGSVKNSLLCTFPYPLALKHIKD
jgi:hypothetical protein